MKKCIALLIGLSLLLTLTACRASDTQYSSHYWSTYEEVTGPAVSTPTAGHTTNQPSANQKKTAAKRTAAESPKTEAVAVPEDSTGDEEVICRSVSAGEWKKIRITDLDKTLSFHLEIPNDWKVVKAGKDAFNIFRGNKKIGTIERDYVLSKYQEFEFGNIADIRTQVSYEVISDDNDDYRYFFIEFVQNTVTYIVNVTVDYEQLDENSCREFIRKFEVVPQRKVFVHPSEANGANKILILGNSFVATSEVGEFLNNMLQTDGVRYYAEPIAIGMANVTTFESRTDICESIMDGNYCYVFLCGLYSDEAVRAVQTIKSCCEMSDTKLVLFPAHNESASAIKKATNAYTDLIILDWKGEINALLDRGAEYSDYCVDDYHKHSKPLAGYVGAHMIYRNLFGTEPPALTSSAPLTESYVNSKLGDYIASGGVIKGYNDAVEETVREVIFG